ncbi:MAG TPA: cytochrome c [Polyangiaceae bacterium]|nr:cytochrome c [Polyangiaceae bacterium]
MKAKHLVSFVVLVASSLAACSGAIIDDAAPMGGGTAPPPAATSGDVARGLALANASSCASCHEADFGGAGFNPNITPDAAHGIGNWTDAQIGNAIVAGQDDDGDQLCTIMERFAFSPQQVADVVAYLRSLPAVTRPTQSECPGHGGGGDD